MKLAWLIAALVSCLSITTANAAELDDHRFGGMMGLSRYPMTSMPSFSTGWLAECVEVGSRARGSESFVEEDRSAVKASLHLMIFAAAVSIC